MKYFEIIMGHLWFLSETVGRVDLHRKHLKAAVSSKTLQPLHPSRTSSVLLHSAAVLKHRTKMMGSLSHYGKLMT